MTSKVLIIDDDPALTDLLTLVLRTQGMDAFKANSGKDGIDLIRSISPDVVILDLMMPDMDGRQVCKNIRSFSKVPILILSALDSPSMVTSALDAGADDYLVKPVPGSVLMAHLNTLTRRAGMEKNNQEHLKVSPEAVPI